MHTYGKNYYYCTVLSKSDIRSKRKGDDIMTQLPPQLARAGGVYLQILRIGEQRVDSGSPYLLI